MCSLLAGSGGLAALPGRDLDWGIYQIYWNDTGFTNGLKKQIQQLGAEPDLILFFRDMHPDRGFPRAAASICNQHGATPVISQELSIWGQQTRDRDNILTAIAAGDYDTYWRTWAIAARAFGQRVILRFGFEMNGDWFSWGQQPELFIAAWRRVHHLVRTEMAANNVEFMFSPNVEWDAFKPLTRITLYYPGDAYVELLGLDGYNFGDQFSKWHQWQSYEEIFAASIDIMAQWSQPLYIAEIGSADGPRKAQWLADFLQTVTKDRRIRGFIYYNFSDGKNNEPNWRLDSDEKSLAIFRQFLDH